MDVFGINIRDVIEQLCLIVIGSIGGQNLLEMSGVTDQILDDYDMLAGAF